MYLKIMTTLRPRFGGDVPLNQAEATFVKTAEDTANYVAVEEDVVSNPTQSVDHRTSPVVDGPNDAEEEEEVS